MYQKELYLCCTLRFHLCIWATQWLALRFYDDYDDDNNDNDDDNNADDNDNDDDDDDEGAHWW